MSWLHNHELCPRLSESWFDSSGSRTSFHHTGHRKHTLLHRADGMPEKYQELYALSLGWKCTTGPILYELGFRLPSLLDVSSSLSNRQIAGNGQRAPSEHNSKIYESRWPPFLMLLHNACRPCHPSSSIRFSSPRNVKHPGPIRFALAHAGDAGYRYTC